jgi:hypothetical protein
MKSLRALACRSQQSFSLGIDPITLRCLVKLQDSPEFILKDQKVPSRTLVTRQAIRYYWAAVDLAKATGTEEWLVTQNQQLQHMWQRGKK